MDFERPISRRRALQVLGAAGIAVGTAGALSACGGDEEASTATTSAGGGKSAAKGGSVTFLTYAVYSDKSLVGEFTKQTGTEVVPENFGELDEMLSKLRANRGAGYDVLSAASNLVPQLASEGLIQPIDTERLTNWNKLYSQFQEADFIRHEGEIYGVPTVWGPEGLMYRTDKISKADSWEILWDEQYDKKMSVIDYDYEMVLTAALYLGMRDQLSQNPISFSQDDLAKIKDALSQQIKLNSKLWSDASEAEALLATGESWVTIGRVLFLTNLRKKNVPVALVNPKEGTQGWVTSTCISAGTENLDRAYAFCDYAISADYGRPLGESFGYPLTSEEIMGQIDEAKRNDMFLQDPNIVDSMVFWKPADDPAAWTKLWNEVKVSA